MDGEMARAAAYIGAAIVMGLGTLGPALAQGMIASKALEKMVQYPEGGAKMRNTLMLSLVLVESIAIYVFIVALLLVFRF